jgi:hypothetical protein
VGDFILGDAGIAARLAVDALRLLVFGGCFVAQTGTHEVLTRVTGHPFRLRIAVCHSLLLRVDLGAGLAEGDARWRQGLPNAGNNLDRL